MAAGETPLRPGIADLLSEARRRAVVLATITTTSRPNVGALLQAQLGREAGAWFAAMICGDEVAAKKPASDVYLAALGVLADRAVAVEDSANGVRSARAAGLAVIAAPSFSSAADDF